MAAELERMGCPVTLRPTAARGDAEIFAREAGAADFDVVAVAGGDGTIAEAANGMMASGSNLPLAVVPMGTANVLAHEIAMPFAPRAMAAVVAGGTARAIYPGLANGRLFLQMAGVGFDAHVVAMLDVGLKKWLGKLAYGWAMLKVMLSVRLPSYRVTIDGVDFEARSVILSKGRYYAGRYVLAPEARLEAPSLQACLLARGEPWALWGVLLALGLNQLHRHPGVRIVAGREVVVEGPDGEPVQADGDPAGRLPLRVTVRPEPLWLIRP